MGVDTLDSHCLISAHWNPLELDYLGFDSSIQYIYRGSAQR
jgi:hypothetical protein